MKLTDVADTLNISVSQIYALVRSGELKAIQIGGRNQWRRTGRDAGISPVPPDAV